MVVVDIEKCGGCGLCADLCPYEGAVTIKQWKSEINEMICRDCGLCVGICPSTALNMKYLTRGAILSRMKASLKSMRADPALEPKVLIFICDWLSRKGASLSDVSKIQHSTNVRAMKFPCIAAVDPLFILNTFLDGADGVLVAGCGAEDCGHIDANVKIESAIKHAKISLKELGMEPERLKFELIPLSAAKAKFVEAVEETIRTVKNLRH